MLAAQKILDKCMFLITKIQKLEKITNTAANIIVNISAKLISPFADKKPTIAPYNAHQNKVNCNGGFGGIYFNSDTLIILTSSYQFPLICHITKREIK